MNDSTGLNQIIDSLFKASPPVMLALFINFTLIALKRSGVQEWRFPRIAMGLGTITYPFIVESGTLRYDVPQPIVYNMVWGAIVGGFSVGLHQHFKQQMKKRFGFSSGDTDQITKEEDNQ